MNDFVHFLGFFIVINMDIKLKSAEKLGEFDDITTTNSNLPICDFVSFRSTVTM